MKARKIVIFELILVLAIGFWQSIYIAVFSFCTNKTIDFNTVNSSYYISGLINAALAIGLMFYVLYKNGYTGADIGLNFFFKWKDLLIAIELFAFSLLVRIILGLILNPLAPSFIQSALHPQNLGFFHKKEYIIFLFLIAIIIPVKEELIVRGFAMTKIFDLTNSKYLAVFLSVLIQFSYHLYQGLPSALLLLIPFITFALYYSKYKNLNAVVYAHMLTDLVSITIFYFKK